MQRSIPKPPPPTPSVPDLAPPLSEDDFLKGGQTARVNGFNIRSSLIPESDLKAELADNISRYYAKRDMLAHAVLPRQTLEGGIVTIQVLEARLGQVKFDRSSKSRLDPQQVEDFIHAQNP